MKRDMALVREVLLGVEEHSDGSSPFVLEIEDHSPEEVSYHVKIMAAGGLVEAIDASSSDDFDWRPISLTWEGHEFLDAARNSTVWRKVLNLIKDKGASVPFEIVKQLLLQGARASLES